eukprot:c22751_g1_i2 orf=415-1425(-)
MTVSHSPIFCCSVIDLKCELFPSAGMTKAHPTTPKSGRQKCYLFGSFASLSMERKWIDLESDLRYATRSTNLVQWYPGHIAKSEKELKDRLKLIDVVIEIDSWIGDKRKILVLNREDMICTEDKHAWANYFSRQGLVPIFTDGRFGSGTMKLGRVAKSVAHIVNARRKAKGLLPRAVRAAIIGYPNVGKSSLINRLLKRRVCEAAPRPGVTRELKWACIGEDLDLLDSPGVLPIRLQDQAAATRLAICNDIGEASYTVAGIAAILVMMLKCMPTAGPQVLFDCYKIEAANRSEDLFLEELAQRLFAGDVNQAACRILRDFRRGKFGWLALERPLQH